MKDMLNIVSDFKSVQDTTERYVIAGMYLLFLKHRHSLDEIESISFNVFDIMAGVGVGFGWGINVQIADFIKKYRIK